MLAVEIAETGSSNMEAITNLIQGELTDLSKLSQLADREGIKKVRFTWKRPFYINSFLVLLTENLHSLPVKMY